MKLPDGRTLGFDDVGAADGAALLYVHGTPDSRRSRHPDDGLATDAAVRLVAVDRPGSGLSTPHPSGSVATFADDMAVLARHLGIDRWSVLAWSAGAPFGLAVAARHPHLVSRVTVVAGLPPVDAYGRPGLLDGASGDRLTVAELGAELGPQTAAEMLAPMLAPVPCDHALAVEHVLESPDPVRRAELDAVPGAIDAMADGIVDAVAWGLEALVHEIEVQLRPLDVDLADVTCPVDLRYGSADPSAPQAFGRWYADTLPNATLEVLDGAGHCFVLPHWADALRLAVRTA